MVHRAPADPQREGAATRELSPAVLALLRHLEEVGFAGAPRVQDGGALEWVEGETPQPYAWSDDAAHAVGELLRGLHDAAASFEPPRESEWPRWWVKDLPGEPRVLGHADTGPWNIVAREGMPVAFIDWETAGPVGLHWELAQTVWLNAQLHDDDIAELWGLPDAAARARQARLILDGYGCAADARVGFVQRLIEVAVYGAAHEAIDAEVTRESTGWERATWALAWRARGAAWMLRNRRLLERALA